MNRFESTASGVFAVATDGNVVRHQASQAKTVSASSLMPKPIDWFWPGRVPFGAVTVLAGPPGLGKSLLTLKLAADLTKGRQCGAPGDALLLSAEDAREQVVLPRLIAAGADLDRVHFDHIQAHGLPRQLFLPDDVPLLLEMVEAHGVRLVVIDPLTAHLPGKVNSWRDQSIRLALAPLAHLAEASGTAIIVVSHLNKGASSDPLQRLGGSIGLAAAARSVLLLARDPDDPEGESGSRRILAQVKTNLGTCSSSLRYQLQTAQLSES
jgi:RecA-family ATPase